MKTTIVNEESFKCLKDTFSIGNSETGYVLCYSLNREGPWTEYETPVPANETVVVHGVTPYMYFKCKNNVGNIVVLV